MRTDCPARRSSFETRRIAGSSPATTILLAVRPYSRSVWRSAVAVARCQTTIRGDRMKIVKFEEFHVDCGWEIYSFLKISTGEGLTGWSEFKEHRRPGIGAAIQGMGEILIGQDPRAIGRSNYTVRRLIRMAGPGRKPSAMSGGTTRRASGTVWTIRTSSPKSVRTTTRTGPSVPRAWALWYGPRGIFRGRVVLRPGWGSRGDSPAVPAGRPSADRRRTTAGRRS